MAKKSKQKQTVSIAAGQKSAHDEQKKRVVQRATSPPVDFACQRNLPLASQRDKTSHHLVQPEELHPDVRSAQNIALLELLDQRPQSSTNGLQRASKDQIEEGRSLSTNQEKELATNLAFLAGVSDSPNHVMGICIEELPDTGGCQVMVAINKRRPSDGTGILEKVQKGFERIFGRLSALSIGKIPQMAREADQSDLVLGSSRQARCDVEEAVFNDIIALCHKRILSRLRSRHSAASSKARKRNRRFIGSVLRDFISLHWQTRAAKSGLRMIEIHRLNNHWSVLKQLLAELEDFEATDVARHDSLLRLVRSFSRAFESVPIASLLASLKDNDMNPNLRAWLLSCFSKICRYHEIASFLCHRAWRISMLRTVRVQIVSNVVSLEDDSDPRENIMDIWQFLARFQYKGESIQMGTLPEWLRVLARSSVERYSQNVHGILNEARVHAEIQLLAHCESDFAKGIRPRILASSKNACALCNTFIAIHGKYSVPKSHGKLYRGWKLPADLQNGPLHDRLNVALESQISETLERLMVLPKRPLMEFDNESSIFSFNLSESTATDCPAPVISGHHSVGAARVDGELDTESGSQGHVTESAHTKHTTSDQTEDGDDEDIAEEGNACVSEQSDDQDKAPMPVNRKSTGGSITTSLARCQPADVRLEHGREIVFSPGTGGTTCFRSRRMELLIDEASSWSSFELLSTTEAEAVLGDDTRPVADVRNIASGIDVLLSKCVSGEVYISHSQEVIRVSAR